MALRTFVLRAENPPPELVARDWRLDMQYLYSTIATIMITTISRLTTIATMVPMDTPFFAFSFTDAAATGSVKKAEFGGGRSGLYDEKRIACSTTDYLHPKYVSWLT